MTKMIDDKSDAYISIVATKVPAPNTFWGWNYEIRLEQFGKVKEVWGLYERVGARLQPHFTNPKAHFTAPILPMRMIDTYED